jgi:hypothetical protein
MTITHTKQNPFGDVTHNGITVHLTQQAYAENCGTDGGVYYQAKGVDNDGNEYRVTWSTYDNADEIESEDEMCDWDDYSVEAL